jgi:hypothetical protein
MKKKAKNSPKLGVLLDKQIGCCSSVHQSRIKAFSKEWFKSFTDWRVEEIKVDISKVN